jgi:hypothetical protein
MATSWILPIGINRGDGVTVLPAQPEGSGGSGATVGTPDPDGDLFVFSSSGNPDLEQDVNNPEIERAEQATFQNVLRGGWDIALSYLSVLSRGTFIEDTAQNVWRILSSKIKIMAGGMAELSIVGESISFDTPPDEFSIDAVELGINIIKHPRYFPFLNPSTSNPVDGSNDYTTNVGVAPNTATVAQIKSAIIRAIQTYVDSPFQPSANAINGLIQNSVVNSIATSNVYVGLSGQQINVSDSNVCAYAIAAAGEIVQKLWKQEDSPYLPAWEITWVQYTFAPEYLDPGAYSASPIGFVPDYFISPTQDGTTTIFDQFAVLNPQAFSSDGTDTGTTQISWLKKADTQEFQRTWFRTVHRWVGSAIGTWDPQIFTENQRVTQPIDNTGVTGFLPLPNA